MGGEQITSTTLHPHAPRREGKGVGAENTPRCLVLVTHWVPHVHQGTHGVLRDTKVPSSGLAVHRSHVVFSGRGQHFPDRAAAGANLLTLPHQMK